MKRPSHFFSLLVGLGLALSAHAARPALTELRVYPADVNLKTTADHQALVVQATYADGVTRDVFIDREAFDAWALRYRARLAWENSDDGERAARMNRVNPKFVLRNHLAQTAIEAAQQGDVVVASKLDRLFRDAADALAQTRMWDKAGIALHLCDMGGGTIDTSSPMGRMMLTMLAGFAEFERALIAERTGAAIRHKQAKGEYIGGGAPYGWQLDAGELVEVPAEQAVVVEAKRLKDAGLSLRAIAAELAAAGHLARTGKPFAAAQVQRMVA